MQQQRDLNYMFQSKECIVGQKQMEFISMMFTWGTIFTDLDKYVNEDLIR